MHDEAIYRCINPACARPAPRKVNFCPYCGTAQARAQDGAQPRGGAGAGVAGTASAAQAAAVAGAGAAAAMSGWLDAPAPDLTAPPSPKPTPTPPPPPPPRPAGPTPPPSATTFGRSGKAPAPSAPPAAQAVPRPDIPARPARREPVRLRWWILALAALWAVWLLAKPNTKKIEKRIDHAVDLARACKGNEAQAELIALRSARGVKDEQLERLQQSLNQEAATCTRKRQRAKAKSDSVARWGSRRDHPLAVPPPGSSSLGGSGAGSSAAGDGQR